ncbi:MAG: hypothetical protein NTV39_00570 [Candidatus Saccharibacteria bacterium]|nr:hypothetical protein [Candidatus Saccharibacteria bacterium]
MYASFLQITLLVTFFLIGVVSATAVRHAYAHFKPREDEDKPHKNTQPPVRLPAEVKEHLLEASEVKFQTIINHSAAELEYDLKTTAAKLDSRLGKLGSEIVGEEMKRYRVDLEQLRKQTEANIEDAQKDINAHQADLKARIDARRAELEAAMNAEVTAEKQVLINLANAKLADAVASFLVETLGHNIDLGTQTAYLTAMLEEHKEELLKGIAQ